MVGYVIPQTRRIALEYKVTVKLIGKTLIGESTFIKRDGSENHQNKTNIYFVFLFNIFVFY